MKTLHLYLTRQIVASLLMTVMVFTFVLLLGNALKEILPLLVSGQVKFGVVAQAVGLLVPFVWVFALPMGMLTATLLIFGRFSADQELTAVRASGISLLSLISPLLLLSIFLCCVSAMINMYLGPRCRVAYNNLRFKLRAEFSSAYMPEKTYIKDFPNYIFYVERNQHGNLEGVLAFALKNETNADYMIRAPRGHMSVDTTNRVLHLTLLDGKYISLGEGRSILSSFGEVQLQFNLQEKQGPGQAKIDDMTFSQLQREARRLEQQTSLPAGPRDLSPAQREARKREWQQGRKELLTPVLFHMHRQVAFSFACFGFTLLGIPLGIRVHRRETNIGIALALLLVAVYYSFIIVGQSLNTHPEYYPYLLVWAPNFLFQALGAVLLWRASRGG